MGFFFLYTCDTRTMFADVLLWISSEICSPFFVWMCVCGWVRACLCLTSVRACCVCLVFVCVAGYWMIAYNCAWSPGWWAWQSVESSDHESYALHRLYRSDLTAWQGDGKRHVNFGANNTCMLNILPAHVPIVFHSAVRSHSVTRKFCTTVL